MERHDEVTGDYGYDLAHEEVGRGTARNDATDRTAGGPHGTAARTGATEETAADLSYDEAHGF
jgi:hypothetical protein